MASMRSTVMAGSSSADSRVPGPPPRTSIAATAGTSNTTAVTPEPRRASSACPTRMPGISVIRLRGGAAMDPPAQPGQDAAEMALGCRRVGGVDEQGAMPGGELRGRPDQDGAALVRPARLLLAVGGRHVEFVARADAAGQRHDGMGGEHVDV